MKPNSFTLVVFSFFRFLFFLLLTACASTVPLNTPTPTSTPTFPSATFTQPTPGPTTTPTPPAGDIALIRFDAPDLLHDLAWSHDGSQLAIAAGTNIHLYAAEGLLEQHLLAVGAWMERIAFHPALPILAAAVKDGSIRFWDTTDGNELCTFNAHAKGANSLAFQPGGNFLASTGNEIISSIWDISSLSAGECDIEESAELIGASYTASDVAFSADGQQFALVDVHNIRLRESESRKLIATLESDLSIFDLAFSPDGHWLAAAQNNASLTLWDLTVKPQPVSTTLQLPADTPQSYFWRVDFSADGHLLAGGTTDGSCVVWKLGGLQPVFSRHLTHAISGLAFQPGSHLLAAGTLDGSVYFWDIDTP